MCQIRLVESHVIGDSASAAAKAMKQTKNAMMQSAGMIQKAVKLTRKKKVKKLRSANARKKRLMKMAEKEITLVQACRAGDVAAVRLLLAKPSTDVNERVPQIEYTPLHYAVFYRHEEITQLLLEAGAQVDLKTSTGLTAMHLAVDQDNVDMCQILLEKCADPSVRDENKRTALHRAIKNGANDVAELLVECSAEEDYRDYIDLSSLSKDGCTPLVTAIIRNDVVMVGMLIEFGADVNLMTVAGDAPIAIAARKNKLAIVRMLVEAGVDASQSDESDMTALEWANDNNCTAVIKYLSTIVAEKQANVDHAMGDDMGDAMDDDVDIFT